MNTDMENREKNLFPQDSTIQDRFHFPIEYFLVILDKDAEDILQNSPQELFVQWFSLHKIVVRCLLMDLHKLTYYHPKHYIYPDIGFDLGVLVTLSYLVNGDMEYTKKLFGYKFYTYDQIRMTIQRTCQTLVYFLCPVFVRFPCSSQEQQKIKLEFNLKYGVSGILGALKCFYVPILNVPEEQWPMYVKCMNTTPSLAVQLICDHNYRFLDVNPRFSGNTSCKYIWEHSTIQDHILSAQDRNIRLIADHDYPLCESVINPYRKTIYLEHEPVYNILTDAHRVVDKAYALLENRFRCLNVSLPFNHYHAANIISSCVALHNFLLTKTGSIE